MKFLATILFTSAFILGTQSSVIPWVTEVVGDGLTYSAVSSPVVHSPWAPWGHAVVDVAPHSTLVHHSVVHSSAPSVAVHAPVIVPEVQGSYVAQTRGAVHTAPLPGHTNSVASINVAPAPGTI